MLNDLTIIIPTHYRAKYLTRILDYYLSIDCRVIILDSTDVIHEVSKNLPANFEYYHCSEYKFIDKLIFGFQKVKTEYCMLIADDDFITPNGINYCLRFLRNNTDYNSAEGSYVGFRFLENQQIQLQNIYEYARDFDYNGETGIARAQQVFQKYMPFFYSVHRSKNLLDNFTLFNNSGIKNLFLMELFTVLYLIMKGKHKVLPVFYSARELMDHTSYSMATPYDIFVLNKKPDELRAFITILSSEYSTFDNISFEEAERGIKTAIDIYCKFAFGDMKNINNSALLKLPRRILSKIKREFTKDLKTDIVSDVQSYKKLTGYEVNEEWMEIEKMILKHHIIEEAPKKESIIVG